MTALRNGNGASPAEHAGEEAPGLVAVKTVAICGTAGSSRDEIMRQPEGVELWGLNRSYAWMPRWSRWFEMHDEANYPEALPEEHLAWLREQSQGPIYMQRARADIPASVTYPLDDVTGGGKLRPYFTSSIAYMLALAIAEGFEEIRLLGANMSIDSEYAYQRAACEYWMGVAEARGIRVYLPPSCPLLRGARYGADPKGGDALRVAIDTIDAIKVQIETTYEKYAGEILERTNALKAEIDACHGALQGLSKITEGRPGQ